MGRDSHDSRRGIPDELAMIMKAYRWAIPLTIFTVAFGISLHYAFTTNFLTACDAVRDYWLYNFYRSHPLWIPMTEEYGLQNTALFSSYFPAMLQRITHLSPEIFFKVYLSLGVALVPVITYFIAKLFTGKRYAIFGSIFVVGWVCFYQGGSFARSNFAMVIYGELILVMLSFWRTKYKYLASGALALLLPFTHYGAAIIGAVVLIGVLVLSLLKRHWRNARYAGVILLVLVVSFSIWQGIANHSVWRYSSLAVSDATLAAATGQSDVPRFAGDVVASDNLVPVRSGWTDILLSLSSRDKITQAFFGSSNPDNAVDNFTLNWWMFGFAWMTVMLMLYGIYKVLRGDYPVLYRQLVFLSLCAIGLTILIPQISRGYGIEKVYYQALMVTAPCLVVGGQVLARKLRLPAWVLLGAVLIPYVGLMWRFGVIPSVLG